jgi:hypothetical protein
VPKGYRAQPVTFPVIAIPPPTTDDVKRGAMDAFSGAEPPKGVETPHLCGDYNFEPADKWDSIFVPAAAIDPAYLSNRFARHQAILPDPTDPCG